jgi:hypothetical protein
VQFFFSSRRLVGNGDITLPQVEEYLDALVVADAMPHAKLLDCTRMVTQGDRRRDDAARRPHARLRLTARA